MKFWWPLALLLVSCQSLSPPSLSEADRQVFLQKVQSRPGMPYRWGGNGPKERRCAPKESPASLG